jgi:hypothetical protein
LCTNWPERPSPHKGTTALAQAGPVLCAAPEMVRVVRDENCAVLVNEI